MYRCEFENLDKGSFGGLRDHGKNVVLVTAIHSAEDALLLGFQSEEWVVRYARRAYTFHLLRFPVSKTAKCYVVELFFRDEHLKASAALEDILRDDEEHEVAFTCFLGRQNVSMGGTGQVLVLQRFPSSPAQRDLEAALIAVGHINVSEY